MTRMFTMMFSRLLYVYAHRSLRQNAVRRDPDLARVGSVRLGTRRRSGVECASIKPSDEHDLNRSFPNQFTFRPQFLKRGMQNFIYRSKETSCVKPESDPKPEPLTARPAPAQTSRRERRQPPHAGTLATRSTHTHWRVPTPAARNQQRAAVE